MSASHNKQPKSDEQSKSDKQPKSDDWFDELRHEIDLTDDPTEKYDLLIELARGFVDRSEYRAALVPMRQALLLTETTGDNHARAYSLRVIGGLQEGLSEYRRALATERRALKLYRALGDRQEEGSMLLNIAITHYRLGDFREALDELEAARAIVAEAGPSTMLANILMTTARIHGTLGWLDRSLDGQLEALRIVETLGESWLLSTLLVNIGVTYLDAEEGADAELYWHRGLDAARANGDRLVEILALQNLGVLYRDRGDLELGLEQFEQALVITRDVDDHAGERRLLGDIGRIHRMRGEYDLALQHLTVARDGARSSGDVMNTIVDTWTIGAIAIDKGEVDQGIEILDEALALCNDVGARSREWGIHQDLSKAWEMKGDIPKAFEHYRRFSELKEEVMGKEQQRAIDNLRTRHEIDTAYREREIIRLENEKLQLEIHSKTGELTSMALHLVRKNEVLDKLKSEVVRMVDSVTGDARTLLRRLVPLIQESIGSEQEWGAFDAQFQQVHPRFVEELVRHSSELSPAEIRVAALLRIQMSTKDIAALLSITTRGVEKHRLQLRHKLGLGRATSLATFLSSIEGG